jgi:hypothetical protein
MGLKKSPNKVEMSAADPVDHNGHRDSDRRIFRVDEYLGSTNIRQIFGLTNVRVDEYLPHKVHR